MIKEFPNLEERGYQKEFLRDWWSQNKLFRGKRQVGKSTLMLCEARRFSECGFDILFLSPSKQMSKILQKQYQELFGERPTFDFGNYTALGKGNFRGFRKDVVILDEFQNISLETYNHEIAPMNPKFLRATACISDMNSVHYLRDAGTEGEIALFDSIYEEI
jgi:predicted AAA+ superfamily ATPase